MPISSLDHINIVTSDLDRSVAFYVEVLGLRLGERPAFEFPGAWLYAGDAPIVHLIAGKRRESGDTGAIDHVALRGDDLSAFKSRLLEGGFAFEERDVPDFNLRQIFVHDPDG